jgi:folate-binding protein YgfZ
MDNGPGPIRTRFRYHTASFDKGPKGIHQWTNVPIIREIDNAMNSQWKAFLESRSATIDREGQARFPDSAVEADCALMDLSALGLIAVSGSAAASFLQGQLTSDVVGLALDSSRLAGHCSPKGRMLASFRIFKLDDTIYLQLPSTVVQPAVHRLRMYLLRTEATIGDASDRLASVGIAGDCAPSLLATCLDAVPEQDNHLTRGGEITTIRIPGTIPRFEILGPPASLEGLWDVLAAKATVVNGDYWALLDIRAGIPNLYPQTSDAFVPQMANLQLLDGVSFKKGCYTGQEVVARMQYLGRLKRRMYRARISSDQPPSPGDALHCPSSSSEQSTGRVVDARVNRDGEYELLTVVEIEAVENGDVRLGGADGPLLSFSDPPYGFPQEN